MHWLNPPPPIQDQSPATGLIVAMFAIVVIFVAVVLYAGKSSAPLLHEKEPQADETRPKEETQQND